MKTPISQRTAKTNAKAYNDYFNANNKITTTMENLKHTKGKFVNGAKGWKIGNRLTNGVKGYEIHWSDDEECVTDHVYTLEDAKLIAAAPDLLDACMNLENDDNSIPEHAWKLIQNAINKATK